jgi:serine/threonine-protein kinase RsbW
MTVKIRCLIASDKKKFIEKILDFIKKDNMCQLDVVNDVKMRDVLEKHYDIIVIDDSIYNDWHKLHKNIKENNMNNIFISIVNNVNINKLRKAFRDGIYDIIHKDSSDNEILHVFMKAMDTSKIMKSSEEIVKYCKHKIFLKIPSDVNLVNEAIMQILNTAKLAGFIKSKDLESNLRLVYTEAVINAIVHGNKSDKNKKVKIEAKITNKKMKVAIEDMGKGFDYVQINNPVNEENILNSSGRGIYLMTTIMDEVKFEKNGSKIILIKNKNTKSKN